MKTAKTATTGRASSPSYEKEELKQDPMMEKMMTAIVSQMGTMINARFAVIEERLLPERTFRLPLADNKKAAPVAKEQQQIASRQQQLKPTTILCGGCCHEAEKRFPGDHIKRESRNHHHRKEKHHPHFLLF